MIPVKQLYHVFRDAWQDEYEYLKEYGLFTANESWWDSGEATVCNLRGTDGSSMWLRTSQIMWHHEFEKCEEDGMVAYCNQDRIVLMFAVSCRRQYRWVVPVYKYLSIPREFADKALVLGGLP